MKIQAINVNNYKLQNANIPNQYTVKYQQSPYYNQNKTSFGSALNAADNILYKGYVMSDYNKHKQRTAVTHLREYIKELL